VGEAIDLHNDSLILAGKAQKGWQRSYLMTGLGNGEIL